VHPSGPATPSFDLKELVDEVRRRGISLPLLIRFTDVLRRRVVHLNEAFSKAIAEHDYKAAVPRRVPHQGEPAPLRRRADRRRGQALHTTGSRPAASPSCWR
jgi:hypothetical protein